MEMNDNERSLLAENERLREALLEIAGNYHWNEQQAIARRALTCDGTCPRGRYCPEHGDLI